MEVELVRHFQSVYVDLMGEYNESDHIEIQYRRICEAARRIFRAGKSGLSFKQWRGSSERESCYDEWYRTVEEIFYAGMLYLEEYYESTDAIKPFRGAEESDLCES